jgi:pyruvate/2-oxoglutarate dehydrogenase complex dihydrolipoamide acyltransferase (E2) component
MATKTTSRSKSRRNGRSSSSNGRSSSQKTEKYRFAQNVGGDETAAEREYRTYAESAGEQDTPNPDVLLDVPVVKVDKIHLLVEELDAHVSLKAKVLDLVDLNVGVNVHLGKLRVDIEGVEAQALVKVRLDHVAAIVDRVFTTIDRNPDLVKSLGQAVEDVGSGAGEALGKTGEGVEEAGEGAGEAVGQLGEGAGQGLGQIGEGAGQAVGNLDQVAGGLGEAAGQAGQGAGQAAGQLGEGAQQAAGQLGQGAEQMAGGGGMGPKDAAKLVASELGSAASDEAKDLAQAATRKVKELGERRRQRRAERHDATEAALQQADELGVDLAEVEGTGAEGRITVRDVKQAATQS